MKLRLLGAVCACSFAFVSHAANASLVIDDFTTVFDVSGEAGWDSSRPANAVGPRSNVFTLTQSPTAGAVGDRTATVTDLTASGGSTGDALIIGTGATIDENGDFVTAPGEGFLSWNGNAGSTNYAFQIDYAVTDLDLSASGSQFSFNFNGDLDDRSTPATQDFTVSLLSGGSGTPISASIALSADGHYDMAFSLFSGVDFSDIDGISISMGDTSLLSPDFGFSKIEVTAVPVPAAVWLFGSGLLGLVGIARRKKAA